MAGTSKLDSFVRKFVILCQSGCDAKLHVQSESGNAFVTLSVGLEQVPPGHHHRVVHRGGELARQRRRERREAERQAAEEAVDDAKNVKTSDAEEKEDVTAKVIGRKVIDTPNSSIPQLNGIFDDNLRDDKTHFELKLEAHEKCTNGDVIEDLQENLLEHLTIRKLKKQIPQYI